MQRAALRWAPAGITIAWILFGILAIPFGGLPEAIAWSNQWIYHIAAAACSLVCLTFVGSPKHRLGWRLICAGSLAWLLGSLYFVQQPTDIVAATMGWDDLGFMLFYPLVGIGILVLRPGPHTVATNRWSRRAQVIRLLDGLGVALSINAICAALTFDQVVDSFSRDWHGTLVMLAYPVLCSLLLGVLVVILAMREWAARGQWWWLTVGIAAFWFSDTGFASTAAQGVYLLGAVMDVGWLAAFACFGCAAITATGPPRRQVTSGWRQVVVPSLFAMAAFGVLVITVFQGLNMVASALAAAAVFVVLARQVLTLVDHDILIAMVRQEARTDALTGLANRRALLDDLQERCLTAQGNPFVLVLFDLDGFKRFNDVFGHPAGDLLLARRGRALQETPGVERAYRLGGDEYCVIVAAGPDDWRPVVRACARALTEESLSYRIASSYGCALVPDEAKTTSQVMQLADRRMYQNKAERRSQGKGIALSRQAAKDDERGLAGYDRGSLAGFDSVGSEGRSRPRPLG